MPIPDIQYRSAAQTDCAPAGVPRKKFLLPQFSPVQLAACVYDVDFETILAGVFPPRPKNTLMTDSTFGLGSYGDAKAIVTGYTQPTTTGAFMGKWAAEFAIVPASWDTYESFQNVFPGFPGYAPVSTNENPAFVGRDANSVKVSSRLHYDYFVLDPDGIIAAGLLDSDGGAVNKVPSLGAIETISRVRFAILNFPQVYRDPPSCIPAGGFSIVVGSTTQTVNNEDGTQTTTTIPLVQFYPETVPNQETYKGWIAAGTDYPVEDSILVNYAGNIWARVTRYCVAQ